MKIYFDESGQSGCVLTKKELLNFQKQPTFALGALVIPTDTQERALCKKYLRFLEKFEIKEEIKGSDTKAFCFQCKFYSSNQRLERGTLYDRYVCTSISQKPSEQFCI